MSEPQQTEAPKTKAVAVVVPMDPHGRFIVNNQDDLKQAGRWAVHIKLAPEALIKDGVEAVMSALTVCHTLNLPYTAMQKMFYHKGNIVVFGTVYSALAERDELYGEKREYWIDDKYQKICIENKNFGQEWAAVVEIKRKDSKEWSAYHFSMTDARQASLYPATKNKWENGKVVGTIDSPDSPWNKYPKDMMMHKARKRAYDANYAKSLNGIDCYEDVREVMERDVTPPVEGSSTANFLNNLV